MSSSKIVFTAAVLLAFGAGFGVALVLQEPRTIAPAQESVRPPAAVPAPRPAPLEAPPERAPEGARIATAEDFRAHFRAGLQAMPREERERGDGVIHGRVRTQAGAPLSGMRLKLQATTAPEFQEGSDLLGTLSRIALQRRWREAHVYETVTDAAGSYRFEGLPNQGFSLTSPDEGYVLQREQRSGRDGTLRPTAEVHWIAIAAATLSFEVVDQGGRPLSRAIIMRTQREPSGSSTSTEFRFGPDQTTTTVPYGTYTFWASNLEHRLAEAEALPVRVTVDATAAANPIRLQVPTTGTVKIHLTHKERPLAPDSLDLVWAQVQAGESPAPELLVSRGQVDRRRPANSPVVLGAMPYGTYVLGISPRFGGKIQAWRTLEVVEPNQELHWSVEFSDELPLIELIALGPKGELVPQLTFEYRLETDSGTSSGGLTLLHAEGGRYTGCLSTTSIAGAGTIAIRAEHAVFGTASGSTTWPPTAPLTLVFAPFAQLDLHVPGIKVHGRNPKLQLSLAEAKGGSFGQRSRELPPTEFNAQERVQLDRLAVGDHVVLLSIAGRDGMSGAGFPVGQVTLGPGSNTASIPFPSLGRLIVEAAQGTELQHPLSLRRREDEQPLTWSLHANEESRSSKVRFEFDLLPHGAYILEGQSSEGMPHSMEVSVAGTTTVVWSPTGVNAIRITITAPESPLASAGFADGDLIVAISGQDLTPENLRQLMMQMAFSPTPVPLRIDRQGRLVDLTVDFKELRKREAELGGSISPASR